jgi:hypothetical protein
VCVCVCVERERRREPLVTCDRPFLGKGSLIDPYIVREKGDEGDEHKSIFLSLFSKSFR